MNISQVSIPLLIYIIVLVFSVGGLVFYLLRKKIETAPSVIVLYGKFVIPFIILFGLWYVLIFNKGEVSDLNDKLNLVGQISALTFAIFVGCLAFLQLARSANDSKGQMLKQRQQFIDPIEKELTEVGWWTGLHGNIGGYRPENQIQWVRDNLRMRINLGHKVNPLNYSFVEKANLLPGISDLAYEEPGLLGLLSGYLLWAKTFNNYLLDIQQFISSQATMDFYRKTTSLTIPLEQIMNSLTPEEAGFAEMLFSKYVYLHFDLIGCDETGHLYSYHKKLYELIQKLKFSTEKQIKDFEKNNFFGSLYK